MNYLYMRTDGGLMLTNNSRSYYVEDSLPEALTCLFSPSNAWLTSLETPYDRHTLIATFSTHTELLDSHPELFI